jgi:hypothetical protein
MGTWWYRYLIGVVKSTQNQKLRTVISRTAPFLVILSGTLSLVLLKPVSDTQSQILIHIRTAEHCPHQTDNLLTILVEVAHPFNRPQCFSASAANAVKPQSFFDCVYVVILSWSSLCKQDSSGCTFTGLQLYHTSSNRAAPSRGRGRSLLIRSEYKILTIAALPSPHARRVAAVVISHPKR